MICDLIKDYQWFVDHADELYSLPYMIVSPKEKETVLRPYREVRDRIANSAPLLIKVLSGELPPGFTLLRTIDDQCLASNGNEQLGIHGPVNEFQARLWCWQHESFNDEIKINIIEDEDEEEVIGLEEVDEAVGDCTGILCEIDGSHAVLDRSMVERIFNKEMWGTW
jgi:hypothetical protein